MSRYAPSKAAKVHTANPILDPRNCLMWTITFSIVWQTNRTENPFTGRL